MEIVVSTVVNSSTITEAIGPATVTPFLNFLEYPVTDPCEPIGTLLSRARAGNPGALQTLLERYREYLRLVIRCRHGGRLQPRMDNSDLVQETCLRAVENFGQFQGENEEAWRGWLGRIAEREVIHQLRRHRGADKRDLAREVALPAPANGSITGAPRLDQWLFKTQTTPSLLAVRKERAQLLADALARLPEDYREVLVLRNLQELDFPEVAERMQRSPGAVRVLWVRALKKLRDDLAIQLSQTSSEPDA